MQRRKKKSESGSKDGGPKKRQRKASATAVGPFAMIKDDMPDYNLEQLMNTLHSLPALPLEEPRIIHNHAACGAFGTASTLNGECNPEMP